MARISFLVPLLLLVCMPPALSAAEIRRLVVERQGAEYRLAMDAVLLVPVDAVWPVLTDYAQFRLLSPSVIESKVLDRLDSRIHRVRTVSRLCVLIFCKEIQQTQSMVQKAVGDLRAVIEPAGSDFEQGKARWQLMPHEETTELLFEAELRPAFWVPPVIGPWVLRRALRQEAKLIVEGLERLARERMP